MFEPRSPLDIVLLVVHILGAILFIGPAAVANSVFPQYLRGRLMGSRRQGSEPFEPDEKVMLALHRISFRYGRNALIVPLAGAGLAISRDRFDEGWLWASLLVTMLAAVLLVATVKEQRRALSFVRARNGRHDATDQASADAITALTRRAGARAGQFNVAWVVILVLMVWRPGSSG